MTADGLLGAVLVALGFLVLWVGWGGWRDKPPTFVPVRMIGVVHPGRKGMGPKGKLTLIIVAVVVIWAVINRT
jgi:hypothetical protein